MDSIRCLRVRVLPVAVFDMVDLSFGLMESGEGAPFRPRAPATRGSPAAQPALAPVRPRIGRLRQNANGNARGTDQAPLRPAARLLCDDVD
jgi:hypothetical protein